MNPQSMFWIKKEISIPLYTLVLLYKSGVEGIYFSWTSFPDVHDIVIVLQIQIFIQYHSF